MSPSKLRKKRNGAGVLLLNRIRIRSRTTTPRQNSRPVQPPLAPLMSPPVLASATADDPTARNPGQLKSASEVGGGKPMIEVGRKEKRATIVEDEEDEWTGCVFEDDTPQATPQSKHPTLNPLEIHLVPVDDVVLVTQPEGDGIEEKEDVYEDMGEDEDRSGDEAEDKVKKGKEYRAIGPQR